MFSIKYPVLFTELFTAKLCHDLAGIIGAIDNCTELINDINPRIKESALQILSVNSKKLVNRLKFYRYTYSIIDPSEKININEIQTLINEYLDLMTHHISLRLYSSIHNNTFLDKLTGKLIICLIIVAFGHIIKNGFIECHISIINNKLDIIIQAIGGLQKMDGEKTNILLGNGNGDNLGIYNCHEYYTAYLRQQIPYELLMTKSDNMIQYSVRIPME